MEINKLITPFNRWFGRDGEAVGWIVLHYTANVGDTAENEARYFASQYIGASAHFFVDEKSVWQSVELCDTAWHCGDNPPSRNGATNRNSVGIEMCTSWKDGSYFIKPEVVAMTLELVEYLLTLYPNAKLCRHYDVTGKTCPEPWVRVPGDWAKFMKNAEGSGQMTLSEKKEFDALKTRVGTLEAKAKAGEEYDRVISREVAKIDGRTGVKWDNLGEMPDWLRPTVGKLMTKGYLLGDGAGRLSVTEDLARALVIVDRAGGFDG